MMLGNWTQHAFVDYDDPGNCYKNSITCINTKYNHKCWNDGYHINHHLKPALHYTDYPKHFLDNLKAFSDNKAIVFIKLHYLQIWYYLMVKNYYTLSKHLAPIHDDCIDEEKAVNFLKSRTKKMPLRGISVQSLKLANTAS
jgi:fatty acid desaturase